MISTSTFTTPVDEKDLESDVLTRWFSGFSEEVSISSGKPLKETHKQHIPELELGAGRHRHEDDLGDVGLRIEVFDADCVEQDDVSSVVVNDLFGRARRVRTDSDTGKRWVALLRAPGGGGGDFSKGNAAQREMTSTDMATAVVIMGCSTGFGLGLMKAVLQSPAIMDPTSKRKLFLLLTSSKERCIQSWKSTYVEVCGKPFHMNIEDDTITVIIEEGNLEDFDCLGKTSDIIKLAFSQFHFPIAEYFIFLNSGSVTPVGHILAKGPSFSSSGSGYIDGDSFDEQLHRHSNLNFVAFTTIARTILRVILKRELPHSGVAIRVVNVSSIAAIKDLPGMSIYGATKAAREAIMRGIASELESEYPQLDSRVLSYAPGPMETEMVTRDLTHPDCPDNFMKQAKSAISFIECDESARKCLRLLTDMSSLSKWKSGDRVDFYDDI